MDWDEAVLPSWNRLHRIFRIAWEGGSPEIECHGQGMDDLPAEDLEPLRYEVEVIDLVELFDQILRFNSALLETGGQLTIRRTG